MKIKKSRLLQIIREEVELHEKNTIEIDESALEELSKEEGDDIIDQEIKNDEEIGNLDEIDLEEYDVEEDQLLTKKKPHEVIPPKK